MTWLVILVAILILVGVIWSLASRVGRGFDVKPNKRIKSGNKNSTDHDGKNDRS